MNNFLLDTYCREGSGGRQELADVLSAMDSNTNYERVKIGNCWLFVRIGNGQKPGEITGYRLDAGYVFTGSEDIPKTTIRKKDVFPGTKNGEELYEEWNGLLLYVKDDPYPYLISRYAAKSASKIFDVNPKLLRRHSMTGKLEAVENAASRRDTKCVTCAIRRDVYGNRKIFAFVRSYTPIPMTTIPQLISLLEESWNTKILVRKWSVNHCFAHIDIEMREYKDIGFHITTSGIGESSFGIRMYYQIKGLPRFYDGEGTRIRHINGFEEQDLRSTVSWMTRMAGNQTLRNHLENLKGIRVSPPNFDFERMRDRKKNHDYIVQYYDSFLGSTSEFAEILSSKKRRMALRDFIEFHVVDECHAQTAYSLFAAFWSRFDDFAGEIHLDAMTREALESCMARQIIGLSERGAKNKPGLEEKPA